MSETATNVTIPAQAEAKVESRSGSGVSWDQLEGAHDAAKPAAAKKEAKSSSAKPVEKEGKAGKDDKEAAGESSRKEAAEKPAKKAEAKDKPAKDGADKEESAAAKDQKPEAKAKAKVHKYRSGDKEAEISGDSLFTVKVDGKDEEASFDDLRSSYSGKQYYERKITEVDRERKEVTKQRDSLNNLANEIFKRSQENPESAYDYLAQMSGKDPIEFKTELYRKQRAEAKEIAAMSDDEFEGFLRQKENDWLKGERTERTARESKDKARAEADQQVSSLKEAFSLDDDAYESSFALAKRYLKSQGKEEDPTPSQVVYASRHVMALETIEAAVPQLASHAQFDSIVEDVVSDLLKDPSITRERLAKVLKETFGEEEDDSAQRRLGRKAQRNAEFDGTHQATRPDPKKKPALTFDDL